MTLDPQNQLTTQAQVSYYIVHQMLFAQAAHKLTLTQSKLLVLDEAA